MDMVSTSPPFASASVGYSDILSPQPAIAAVRRLCVGAVDRMRFESVVRRYYLMLRCASSVDGDPSAATDDGLDALGLDDQVLAYQAFLLQCHGISVPTTAEVRAAIRSAFAGGGGRGHGGLAPPGHLRLVPDGSTTGTTTTQHRHQQHKQGKQDPNS